MRRSWIRGPLDDTLCAMDRILGAPRPLGGAVAFALSFVATWHLYVPVHELLHALGCVATGGDVSALEIQVQYGGALLAEVLPFVVPGGEYAGRLSGFDPHGSDLVYLATDALPFALSVLVGVPALRLCALSRRPLAFGPAVVLGLAPFYNVPGDYYEMGSILVTAAVAPFGADFSGLRADDLFLLIERLFTDPAGLGVAGPDAATLSIVAGSTVLAVVLAFATWAAGDALATRWVGPSAPYAPRDRAAEP